MKRSIIIIISWANLALASNSVIECETQNKISNVAEQLNAQDCGLAQGLVKNSEVQNYHRNKIYEKLSEKLAIKVQQTLEEMTLLDQYYSSNKAELLPQGKSDVQNNCRSDSINEIENCHGKINPNNASYKFKLELLKKKIKNTMPSSCTKQDLNLQDILRNKVIQTLGVSSTDTNACGEEQNSCPIQGNTGAFILSSQLDKISAEEFLGIMQNYNDSPDNIDGAKVLDTYFNKYPQFKIIKDANGKLKKGFLKFLKSYTKDKGPAKEYINTFFINNEENRIPITETLATKCKELNDDVELFLCSNDLKDDQLASLNSEASLDLFGLDPNLKKEEIFDDAPGDGVNFYSAYGFQCLAKAEKESGIILKRENSVDSWFQNFTKNIRPTLSSEDVATSNNYFCSIFKCIEKSVKTSNICINGGPMTAEGMKRIFDCDHKECTSDILKYISYLEGLKNIETIQLGTNLTISSGTSTNETDVKSKPRYSAFLENYLGAKGTLIAEGRKITATTIAQKSKEIADRKPESSTGTSVNSSTHESKKTEIKASETSLTIATIAPPENTLTQTTTAPTVPYEQFAPITNSPAVPSKRLPTVATTKPTTKESSNSFNFGNNERDSEVQKMRSELEELTKSMKGTEAEKLATITDTNSKYSPKDIGGSNKSNPDEGLNRAERERNAEYQRNLAAWESRLRTRESELFSREFRGPASSGESSNSKLAQNNGNGVRASKTDSAVQLTATEKEKGSQSKPGTNGSGSGSADSPETIVSSDDLANLKLDSLKKLGINSNSAFIMKISHKGKFYNISVKSFLYKGKDILVPLLNESNSALAHIILESPLFSDYKQMQINRQKERQDFAKNL